MNKEQIRVILQTVRDVLQNQGIIVNFPLEYLPIQLQEKYKDYHPFIGYKIEDAYISVSQNLHVLSIHTTSETTKNKILAELIKLLPQHKKIVDNYIMIL
jgi:hypothetical protein